MRCGIPGIAWHVTAKSSFCVGVCFINLAFTQGKLVPYPGDLYGVSARAGLRGEKSSLTAVQKSAEGIVEAEASKA